MLPNATLAQGLSGHRYAISDADIAKALSAAGVSVEASQVHLPARMSETIESPRLEIATAKPMGDNQLRILNCIVIRLPNAFLSSRAVDVKHADLISTEIQPRSAVATPASHQTTLKIDAGQVRQPRLRVGSHAVLRIRDGHLDIHLQVMAIDTGVVGQQVRVCTLDRKMVFHAIVTGEGTVTGVME